MVGKKKVFDPYVCTACGTTVTTGFECKKCLPCQAAEAEEARDRRSSCPVCPFKDEHKMVLKHVKSHLVQLNNDDPVLHGWLHFCNKRYCIPCKRFGQCKCMKPPASNSIDPTSRRHKTQVILNNPSYTIFIAHTHTHTHIWRTS